MILPYFASIFELLPILLRPLRFLTLVGVLAIVHLL
jgi:hypothetical protein